MFLIDLGDSLALRGDDLQFVITRKTSPIAYCGDLCSIPNCYKNLMPNGQSTQMLSELAVAFRLVHDKIKQLSQFKMISRLDLESKYFILYDRDSFCLERARPERVDKSKNFGYWGQWHLHYALTSYADQMVRHAEVTTAEQAKNAINSVMLSIESTVASKIAAGEWLDQGTPPTRNSRDVVIPTARESTGVRSTLKVLTH